MFFIEIQRFLVLFPVIHQRRAPTFALRIHLFRLHPERIGFVSTGCQATVPEVISAGIRIPGLVRMDSPCWQSLRATRRYCLSVIGFWVLTTEQRNFNTFNYFLHVFINYRRFEGLPFLQGLTSFILKAVMELHEYGTATLESVLI